MDSFDRNQQEISDTCDEVKALLLEKNKAYGDSALNPVRIFSKASPVEQLKVRIDDKLSRLVRGEEAGEDVFKDLLGYMVLLRIAMKREQEGEAQSNCHSLHDPLVCDFPECKQSIAFTCVCRRCTSEPDSDRFHACVEHAQGPGVRLIHRKHERVYPNHDLNLALPREPLHRCDFPHCAAPATRVCSCRRCSSELDEGKFRACEEHATSDEGLEFLHGKHKHIYPTLLLRLTVAQ